MIRFDLIQELDGAQLMQELQSFGIVVNSHRSPSISEGSLWLDISPLDTQKAQDVLNAHIPKPRPEPSKPPNHLTASGRIGQTEY